MKIGVFSEYNLNKCNKSYNLEIPGKKDRSKGKFH
jgi:hypothetical protein